jgi:glycosyltransferase involved in cell wall biosynthesis
MPAFFAGFDLFIIPYNLNDYTVTGCFPVKFLDALAAGLPTVVTNLPAYADYKNVAYVSEDREEFSQFIQKALNDNSPGKVEERMRVARENSWNNKIEKMLHIISATL